MSELPKSPLLYLDQSANTAAQQLEQEDEIDEPEEIEPPSAVVPFSRLFACVDNLDWALMFIGSFVAASHSTALVVYLHYFAKIVHILSIRPHNDGNQQLQLDKLGEVIFFLYALFLLEKLRIYLLKNKRKPLFSIKQIYYHFHLYIFI